MKKIIGLIVVVAIALGGYVYMKPQVEVEDYDVDSLLVEDSFADLYAESNRLEVTSGTATITQSDGVSIEVSKEQNVNVGDVITVSEDSTATLHWFDGSISRLQAGTELTIEAADYNPENVSETDIKFNVVSGEVWSKVIDLVDEDSSFLSEGGTVVAGVRGSAFNFIVPKIGPVEVKSFEHAAFIASLDDDGEIEEGTEETIVSGEQVTVEDDEITVEEIPEEELSSDWVKENTERDEKAKEEFQERNLNRLKRLAGPLPGEPGYEKKQEAIQERLDSIEDPEERAEFEAKIARVQAHEAIALAASNKGDGDVAEKIAEVAERIENADIPLAQKEKIKAQLQNEVKAASRAVSQTLPDNEELYELKQALREQHLELEDNPEKKERIQEKLAERKLFEVDDLTKKDNVKAEIIERQLEKIEEEFGEIDDRIKDRPGLLEVKDKFIEKVDLRIEEKIEAGDIDPERAEKLKERVEERKERLIEDLKDKLPEGIDPEEVSIKDLKNTLDGKIDRLPPKLKDAIKDGDAELIDRIQSQKEELKDVKKENVDLKQNLGDKKEALNDRIDAVKDKVEPKVDTVDADRAAELKRRIQEAEKRKAERLKNQAPPASKEPVDTIKKEAPFHQGPSVQ